MLQPRGKGKSEIKGRNRKQATLPAIKGMRSTFTALGLGEGGKMSKRMRTRKIEREKYKITGRGKGKKDRK